MAEQVPPQSKLTFHCAICSGNSHGMHFGCESCRACAAFFRRTVAMKLVYQCRSQGKCDINKELRCLCRHCRYQKCLRAGMRISHVHLNRFDPLPAIRSDSLFALETGLAINEEQSPASPPLVLPTTTDALEGTQSLPGKPDSPETSGRDSVIVAATEPEGSCTKAMTTIFARTIPHESPGTLGLLASMSAAYHRMLEKRKLCRRATASSLADIFGAEETAPTITNVSEFNSQEHIHACKIQLMLFAEFFSEIKYFADFKPELKLSMFTRQWRNLLLLDRAYETVSLLGFDEADTRLIVYNRKAFNVHTVTCVESETKNMATTEIQRLFSPSLRYMYEFVVLPMKRLRPTEFEYLIMLGLIIWKSDGNNTTHASMQATLDAAKAEVLQSVHDYYVQQKMTCYAPRLAGLMEIIAAVEKAIDKSNEDAVLASLFDVFKCDIYLKKLLDE